jgi:tetratricopeptide (TPR) repeat protein
MNNSASVYYNQANVWLKQRRVPEAIAAFRRALELQPDYVEAMNNLGNALRATGRSAEALPHFRRAAELRPDVALIHNNLGTALNEQRQFDEAIAAFQKAVAIQPDYAEAYSNLGHALIGKEDFESAVAACRRAAELRPEMVELHVNLANALRQAGKADQAIAACSRAIELRPDHAEAFNNLGYALCYQARFPEAKEAFRKAVGFRPNHASAHWNLGLLLLREGNYAAGWQEYEWRWRVAGLGIRSPKLDRPAWNGGPLDGKRILLWDEQGLGDTIHLIRYVPEVIKRGGRIILACKQELLKLFQQLDGIEQLMPMMEPLPQHDVHCPILSLPGVLRTTIETIPRDVPYLKADTKLAEQWEARMPKDGHRRIGLVWSGKRAPDPLRATTLAALAPLASLKNAWFCSLQKGEPSQQVKTPPPGLLLTDWTEEFHDLTDTAALIDRLDLVITVDTVIAHLAGAMGKPTWVLLSFVPDWRWMMDRSDSPWYPTMKLFRQKSHGDWTGPIEEIRQQLQ